MVNVVSCRHYSLLFRQKRDSSRLASSKAQQPSVAALHSSNKLSELSQWLCKDVSTINHCCVYYYHCCYIVIVIVVVVVIIIVVLFRDVAIKFVLGRYTILGEV